MRYVFVFLSILMIWIAALLLAAVSDIDALLLALVVIVMTLVLFVIGFRKGKA